MIGQVKISSWVFHTARIHAIVWSSDSLYAASGSLDSNIYIYSVNKPMKKLAIKNAHLGGVTGVEWLEAGKIASVGADSCVKLWDVVLPA